MSVVLYFDVHVRRAVTQGLRLREVDVLTAQEDDAATMDDPILLDRAMALGRVVFTQDEDFLREAHRRQETGEAFAGVIYAHQLNVTIGQCVSDLELIAKVYEPADLANRVEYLPLEVRVRTAQFPPSNARASRRTAHTARNASSSTSTTRCSRPWSRTQCIIRAAIRYPHTAGHHWKSPWKRWQDRRAMG